MPKDTGELIFKKSINLYCQPIFSYISSFVIAPYAPFSQSLSQMLKTSELGRGIFLGKFFFQLPHYIEDFL